MSFAAKGTDTDDHIFNRRYNLSEILKQRLTALVEYEALAIFQHKPQNLDIRFELDRR